MPKKILYCLVAIILMVGCKNDEEIKTGNVNDTTVYKKPKNIILLIGDGMGIAQIDAAMIMNKGFLNILQFPYVGLVKTYSANNYITDSGAGATAISCGQKTNNGYIGESTDDKSLKTILEYAEDYNLSTGLVVTSTITHATPAAFIAHLSNRNLEDSIATFFIKVDIDVLIGGGRAHFDKRADGRNLLDSLRKRNYSVTFSMEENACIDSGKLACLTADVQNPRYSEGRGNMLPNSVETAINILKKNKKGFFLMAEGSQIDWGGHQNDINYVVEEVMDFDRAVEIAYNFAKIDSNTLVIVTADHETGGLSILNGNTQTGEVEAQFSTTAHTGVMVPVYAYGPGAEIFTGIFENTAIFDKMMLLYGFKN